MSGHILSFLSSAIWGVHPILAHHFVTNIDPLFLSGLASIISSVPFIFILIYQRKLQLIISQRFFLSLIFIAFIASVGWALLFAGTKLTSGINTGMLLQIEPLYAIIIGTLFLREVIKKQQIIATSFMMAGAVIIVYKGHSGFNIGDILILLAPLFFQVSHTIGKKMFSRGMTLSGLLAGRQLYGGAMFLIIYLFLIKFQASSLFSSKALIPALILGFLEFVELALWYSAIKRISLSTASAFIPFAAVFAFLGSVFFLKEHITLQHYFGFFFIMIGLVVLSRTYVAKNTQVA